MTDDVITLIQELGFPIAVCISLAFVLYKVIMWLMGDIVKNTLNRFDEKHENSQHRLDLLDKKMTDFEREMMDEFGKLKKWSAESKSDQKIIVDYILKGK